MNKMTKGALATGLGVALLVGGGGTLAVWNANAGADAGTIMSGNLNITAEAGVWTNAISTGDESIDISTYKMVPGDTLTFTQPVTVDLIGDLMKATLTLTDPKKATEHLMVSDITLTDKNGQDFTETALDPADSGKYTAKVTVELPDTVDGQEYVNKTHQLETIGFALEQDATGTVAAQQ